MFSNQVNYFTPWKVDIDPARQGFTYVPVNGKLCEYLNINTMLPLFFDPVNMMNVENNRKIAEMYCMGQEIPKMRISGFNKRSAPILDELLKAQEERVKIDQKIAKEGYLIKKRLEMRTAGLITADSPIFSNFLPNTQQFQYTQAWYPLPPGYGPQNGYPNPIRENPPLPPQAPRLPITDGTEEQNQEQELPPRLPPGITTSETKQQEILPEEIMKESPLKQKETVNNLATPGKGYLAGMKVINTSTFPVLADISNQYQNRYNKISNTKPAMDIDEADHYANTLPSEYASYLIATILRKFNRDNQNNRNVLSIQNYFVHNNNLMDFLFYYLNTRFNEMSKQYDPNGKYLPREVFDELGPETMLEFPTDVYVNGDLIYYREYTNSGTVDYNETKIDEIPQSKSSRRSSIGFSTNDFQNIPEEKFPSTPARPVPIPEQKLTPEAYKTPVKPTIPEERPPLDRYGSGLYQKTLAEQNKTGYSPRKFTESPFAGNRQITYNDIIQQYPTVISEIQRKVYDRFTKSYPSIRGVDHGMYENYNTNVALEEYSQTKVLKGAIETILKKKLGTNFKKLDEKIPFDPKLFEFPEEFYIFDGKLYQGRMNFGRGGTPNPNDLMYPKT